MLKFIIVFIVAILVCLFVDSKVKNIDVVKDNNYVYVDKVGYRITNTIDNSVKNLNVRIANKNLVNFLEKNFDKYCILSIKNLSKKTIVIRANSETIVPKAINYHNVDSSANSFEASTFSFREPLEGTLQYVIKPRNEIKLYLPYKAVNVDLFVFQLVYEVLDNKRVDSSDYDIRTLVFYNKILDDGRIVSTSINKALR